MTGSPLPQLDWGRWLARWDAQQQGYVAEREERFAVMFDVLADLLPESFTAVDLGCGPGSLAVRLLERFPAARVVALDMDPVMLAVGRGAVGSLAGRLSWRQADLADPAWSRDLPPFDAALSSTALHWLHPGELAAVYAELARLLRLGGLLLNGDHLAFGPTTPTLVRLCDRQLGERWSDAAFAARGEETAEQWWADISAEPGMEPLLVARDRAYAGKVRQPVPPDLDAHVAALRRAGFSEVGTVWQRFSDRVLLAIR